jgi:hypothetical protein
MPEKFPEKFLKMCEFANSYYLCRFHKALSGKTPEELDVLAKTHSLCNFHKNLVEHAENPEVFLAQFRTNMAIKESQKLGDLCPHHQHLINKTSVELQHLAETHELCTFHKDLVEQAVNKPEAFHADFLQLCKVYKGHLEKQVSDCAFVRGWGDAAFIKQ